MKIYISLILIITMTACTPKRYWTKENKLLYVNMLTA